MYVPRTLPVRMRFSSGFAVTMISLLLLLLLSSAPEPASAYHVNYPVSWRDYTGITIPEGTDPPFVMVNGESPEPCPMNVTADVDETTDVMLVVGCSLDFFNLTQSQAVTSREPRFLFVNASINGGMNINSPISDVTIVLERSSIRQDIVSQRPALLDAVVDIPHPVVRFRLITDIHGFVLYPWAAYHLRVQNATNSTFAQGGYSGSEPRTFMGVLRRGEPFGAGRLLAFFNHSADTYYSIWNAATNVTVAAAGNALGTSTILTHVGFGSAAVRPRVVFNNVNVSLTNLVVPGNVGDIRHVSSLITFFPGCLATDVDIDLRDCHIATSAANVSALLDTFNVSSLNQSIVSIWDSKISVGTAAMPPPATLSIHFDDVVPESERVNVTREACVWCGAAMAPAGLHGVTFRTVGSVLRVLGVDRASVVFLSVPTDATAPAVEISIDLASTSTGVHGLGASVVGGAALDVVTIDLLNLPLADSAVSITGGQHVVSIMQTAALRLSRWSAAMFVSLGSMQRTALLLASIPALNVTTEVETNSLFLLAAVVKVNNASAVPGAPATVDSILQLKDSHFTIAAGAGATAGCEMRSFGDNITVTMERSTLTVLPSPVRRQGVFFHTTGIEFGEGSNATLSVVDSSIHLDRGDSVSDRCQALNFPSVVKGASSLVLQNSNITINGTNVTRATNAVRFSQPSGVAVTYSLVVNRSIIRVVTGASGDGTAYMGGIAFAGSNQANLTISRLDIVDSQIYVRGIVPPGQQAAAHNPQFIAAFMIHSGNTPVVLRGAGIVVERSHLEVSGDFKDPGRGTHAFGIECSHVYHHGVVNDTAWGALAFVNNTAVLDNIYGGGNNLMSTVMLHANVNGLQSDTQRPLLIRGNTVTFRGAQTPSIGLGMSVIAAHDSALDLTNNTVTATAGHAIAGAVWVLFPSAPPSFDTAQRNRAHVHVEANTITLTGTMSLRPNPGVFNMAESSSALRIGRFSFYASDRRDLWLGSVTLRNNSITLSSDVGKESWTALLCDSVGAFTAWRIESNTIRASVIDGYDPGAESHAAIRLRYENFCGSRSGGCVQRMPNDPAEPTSVVVRGNDVYATYGLDGAAISFNGTSTVGFATEVTENRIRTNTSVFVVDMRLTTANASAESQFVALLRNNTVNDDAAFTGANLFATFTAWPVKGNLSIVGNAVGRTPIASVGSFLARSALQPLSRIPLSELSDAVPALTPGGGRQLTVRCNREWAAPAGPPTLGNPIVQAAWPSGTSFLPCGACDIRYDCATANATNATGTVPICLCQCKTAAPQGMDWTPRCDGFVSKTISVTPSKRTATASGGSRSATWSASRATATQSKATVSTTKGSWSVSRSAGTFSRSPSAATPSLTGATRSSSKATASRSHSVSFHNPVVVLVSAATIDGNNLRTGTEDQRTIRLALTAGLGFDATSIGALPQEASLQILVLPADAPAASAIRRNATLVVSTRHFAAITLPTIPSTIAIDQPISVRMTFTETAMFSRIRPADPIVVNVTVAPLPVPLTKALVDSAETAGSVASVSSGVTGSPTTAVQASRVGLMSDIRLCSSELEEDLDWVDSPTQLVAASPDGTGAYAGALVGNVLFVCACLFVHWLVAFVYSKARDVDLLAAKSTMRFPSASMFVVLLLMEPSFASIFVIFAMGRNLVPLATATFATLTFATVVGYFAYFLSRRFGGKYLPTGRVDAGDATRFDVFFDGPGKWRDKPKWRGFVDRNRLLFAEYKGEFHWYLLVEVAVSFTLAIAQGLVMRRQCGIAAVLTLVVWVCYVGLAVWKRPYISTFAFGFAVATGAGQAFGSLLNIVYAFGNKDEAIGTVVDSVVIGVMYLITLRSIADLFLAAKRITRSFRKWQRRKRRAEGGGHIINQTEMAEVEEPLTAVPVVDDEEEEAARRAAAEAAAAAVAAAVAAAAAEEAAALGQAMREAEEEQRMAAAAKAAREAEEAEEARIRMLRFVPTETNRRDGGFLIDGGADAAQGTLAASSRIPPQHQRQATNAMDDELARQALLGRMAAFGQRVTAQGQAYDEATAVEVHANSSSGKKKQHQSPKPVGADDELDDLLELAPTGSFAFAQRPQAAAPENSVAPATTGDELDDLLL